MDSKKQTRRSRWYQRIALIVAAVLLVVTAGVVFARYVHDNEGGYLVSAKEFYFTSDLLKEETADYVLNSAVDEISFSLGNNEDKLRFSQVDIGYVVTVATQNGGALPEILDSRGEPKLWKGAVDQTTVTLKGLEQGETYTVTVTGEGGYEKTLSARFAVSDGDRDLNMHLAPSADDSFVLLTVWSNNVTGDLEVSFPAGLIPDNTDPILEGVQNYSLSGYGADSFSDTENFDEAYSSRSYRFFVDSGSFTANQFTVVLRQGMTQIFAEAKDTIPDPE